MDNFVSGVQSVATGHGLGFLTAVIAILVLLAFFGWGPMRIANELESRFGGGGA